MIRNCLFTFSSWKHVSNHVYFEKLEERASRKLSTATGSTDASDKKFEITEEKKQIAADFESVPLNESFTYEEVAGDKKDVQLDLDIDVVADLENLIESGFSELCDESEEEEKEEEFEEVKQDDSPFPMGVQVFDVSEDDFEMLGSSSDGGFDDYEVICASET